MPRAFSSENKSGHQEHSARVEQIVTEAGRLFREKGFAATSMNDVAHFVGVSKPALYHHFANKEDLFLAVVVRDPERAADKMATVAGDGTMSARAKLGALLDLAYDTIVNSESGRLMHTIVETAAKFPAVAKGFRDGFLANQQLALGKIIDDGVRSGEFRDCPHPFMNELTFGPPIKLSMDRAMFGALPDSPPVDLEAVKVQHLQALLSILT